MSERRSKMIQHVIVPIAILVLVAMSTLVAFIWFSASTQDRIALQQSIKSVREAINRRLDHVGVTAKDYSWWNDSALNLDVRFDPDWAHTNIGFYAYDVHGFELSFVVDRQGRTIYGQIEGEQTDASAFEVLSENLATLIATARAASTSEPAPAVGLLPIEDGIAAVGVSAVTPEDASVVPLSEGPRVVLVYARKMTQELLDDIAEPLPLTGLRLVGPNAAPDIAARFPLTSPNGEVLGHLIWQPHRPGWQFLSSVSPALGIAMLLIGAFTYAVLRHARETTGAIEASEARFRDVADASSDWLQGAINGFAAGALLVMLVDSMIPEATRQAGRTTGLITTFGFAVAAGLSGVS